ncbi:MAG: 2-oxo acid dehydrogenase subunit E2 [Planctomycetes bacterium]|nr:2-oxo acid dehydrogenase subunit E2 [Planctomycetota bacterium]MBL7145987.1 2-oxo acid dehydrogenase subunit E2 [Phycisphaerae bacterium]
MATAVIMPQVGQDIETATIVDWIKKENDSIQKGDIIATVESDKAAFDVEAYESGVLLKILYKEGDEVKVLTPIAYIGQPGEKVGTDPPAADTSSAPEDNIAPSMTEPKSEHRGPAASPSARRLARGKGIDLKTVTGTGPGGRITKEDVLNAAERTIGTEAEEVIPFSPMRAKIAERLTHSKQTIPHFTLFADIDMTEANTWRRQFNESQGIKITVTDMIVKAVASILCEFPHMNAHVAHDKIILKKAVNVGVAVSVTDGLAVPVISEADTKTLIQISNESRKNTEAIRKGKLLSNAIGSFTISNLGMHAVDKFVPIINPPECAILALGQAVDKPAVVNGALCIRYIMTATLACDHRAVDGTDAARFMEAIKHHLENPTRFEE